MHTAAYFLHGITSVKRGIAMVCATKYYVMLLLFLDTYCKEAAFEDVLPDRLGNEILGSTKVHSSRSGSTKLHVSDLTN